MFYDRNSQAMNDVVYIMVLTEYNTDMFTHYQQV